MPKIKVGDIVVNPWVGKDFFGKLNPMYATVYLGNNQSLDYKLNKHTWVDKIYRDDNEREWKVIGHIDLQSVIKEEIEKCLTQTFTKI